MEVSGQLHAPAALTRGEEPRYPLDRWPGGPQSRSGRCAEEKNLASAGNRTPAVQPVDRCYTDCAISVWYNFPIFHTIY
jgi:hypothetical protein